MKFDYAILRNDGKYYTGRTFDHPEAFSGNRLEIFTYTEHGAHRKISLFPQAFANCRVVRLN